MQGGQGGGGRDASCRAQATDGHPAQQHGPNPARTEPKTTAQRGTQFMASALQGNAMDWAFAFWGGSFYIFLERDSDSSTIVWKMDSSTGAVTKAVNNTGRNIVGAGVSTCAPITIN